MSRNFFFSFLIFFFFFLNVEFKFHVANSGDLSFGIERSKCYFNFAFQWQRFIACGHPVQKPPPPGVNKRKLHHPKHEISQLKWNRLNVAELRVTDGVVVSPSITAPYSDAGLLVRGTKQNGEFQLTAWKTFYSLFRFHNLALLRICAQIVVSFLIYGKIAPVVIEMKFVSASTKPALAIIL